MDIEAVAHDTPEKIHTIAIDPEAGVTADDIAKISAALALEGAAAEDAKSLFPALYKAFNEKDMALLEINPLIVMTNGHLRVLDAKVSFDGNALFRHDDVKAFARRDRRRRPRKSRPPSLAMATMEHHQAFTARSRQTSATSAVAPARRRWQQPSDHHR
ncbi:hypothetical protein Lal_00045147 [Lupinus albus]|nr:hypothetical protein Lal_00045147 [Lupinus albus]